MAERIAFDVKSLESGLSPEVVVLVGPELVMGEATLAALGEPAVAALRRAAAVDNYKAKAKKTLAVLAPEGAAFERVVLIGLPGEGDKADWAAIGGTAFGALSGRRAVSLIADAPGLTPEQVADIALGMRLRAYRFDAYKTKKDDEDKERDEIAVTLHVAQGAAVKKLLKARNGLAAGVNLARNLVNEPPNVLFPKEFAKRAEALSKLGVEVEVLDEKQLAKIGMRALLGVGQGSSHESRVVIMRWNGAKGDSQPVAVIGKGVTFDTGGISIKPAAGMEDMKGDMAGAACVVGLMHALAARKAKVNVIGAIGLVENMPDGNAQRPGDIVTSLSGQTIEIINTDAEGRLVLADVLWYVQDKYKPAWMINLATLTGAILVALGKEHAGLFSNDDELSTRLTKAGEETGETVWRLPLGKAYDKMIDSKFADMKNTGGRFAGSITAAQFLQRFVNNVPWAHLDIAGTGMDSAATDISKSWASGWGVRLLDRLIAGQER